MLFVIGVAVQRLWERVSLTQEERDARSAFLLAEIDRQAALFAWAA